MENREVGFVVNDEYKAWIEDIKNRIKQSQVKAPLRFIIRERKEKDQ